jgi:hypothetical protein
MRERVTGGFGGSGKKGLDVGEELTEVWIKVRSGVNIVE